MQNGKSTLAAVRSAISIQRQKRILKGSFTSITELSNAGGVFSTFDNDDVVLEYPPTACSGTKRGCWSGSGTTYTYKSAGSSTDCTFTLADNKLTGSCAAFD